MLYLEYLSTRQRVPILAIVLAILGLIIVLTSTVLSSPHVHFDIGDGSSLKGYKGRIPLSALFGLAGFIAIGMAQFLGGSLNSLTCNAPSVWTKPVPRERMALSIFAVDALVIVASWIVGLAVTLLTVAGIGLLGNVDADPRTVPVLALGLGAAFMSYGIAQALTAWNQQSAMQFIGIAWGCYFAFGWLALAPLAPLIHQALMAINIFNPLAYYGFNAGHSAGTHPLIGLPIWTRTAIVFAFALVTCGIAAVAWKRMEI